MQRLILSLSLVLALASCDIDDFIGSEDVTPGPGEDSAAPAPDASGEDVGGELPDPCENQCSFFGEKSCASETGWQECVPAGTCLVWNDETPCDAGTLCQEGECVAAFGDLECLEISTCMGDCDEVEACQQDCFTQGSETGQTDWVDLATCIETHCKALFDAGLPAAGGKCTLEHCKAPYLVCTPVGTENCKDSLACLQGCNGDEACIGACLLDADYDALVEMADIMVCFEEKCPDPADWETCATTSCLMPVLGCL